MNITELARKLKVPTKELKILLPELGFDIGKKAIKVDDKVANQIIKDWRRLLAEYQAKYSLDQTKKASAADSDVSLEDQVEIVLPSRISVKDLAEKLGLPLNNIMRELMKNGIMVSLNEEVDFDTAAILAEDLGKKVVQEGQASDDDEVVGKHEMVKKMIEESDEALKKRPPVIVIMGHVDHGKTKLLDTIKKTNVVAEESGGITQHIGAYQIEKKDKKITFIDTPGHEAFTTMRTRGSRIADIAILVVAADDGVQPQTKEALRIIKNAGIPMIVAINKIDKPEANVEKIKKELSENNIIPEEWGGDTIVLPISAHTGDGIDNLLDTLLLIAETEEDNLKTDWTRLALGTVIESHMDKSEGTVATILVQAGILKNGSIISIDNTLYGRIRVMKDHLDQKVEEAEPGTPVKVLGLKAMPTVGDIIEVKESEKGLEKKIKTTTREQFAAPTTAVQEEDDDGSSLKVILKTDTLGSSEAIIESIAKLNLPEGFKIDFVHKGLGNINENDIQRAKAADAVIVGFHIVSPTTLANTIDEEGVTVKNFEIIYELLDFLKEKIIEVVKPTYKQKEIGTLKILKNFKQTKKSQVVGGSVTEGEIKKDHDFSLKRGGQEVGTGKIIELQSGKEAVASVSKGAEAGLEVQSLLTIEEGDHLVVYETIEEQIKL